MSRLSPFLVLLTAPALAQELPRPYQKLTPPAAPVVIPVQLAGSQILVDGVRVNGQGPFRFLFDTGAMGGGRVDVSLAQALGLEQTGVVRGSDGSGRAGPEMAQYTLDELEFGGLAFAGVHVVSRDYNLHGAASRGHIDGVLGIGLFEALLLTIDYPDRELRVAVGELPEGGGTLDLQRAPTPTLSLELGGKTRTARVDTGNSGGLTVSQEIAAELAFTEAPVEIGQARTVSGAFAIRTAPLDGSVTLGDAIVRNPDVVIAPMPDVNLGSRFLREFETTFDFANSRVRFVHAPQQRQTAPARTSLRTAVTVPLRTAMGRPVVDVRIGDRTVPMIVDTGAGTTVLFARLVEELGLESTGSTRVGDPTDPEAVEAPTYELATLALGDARFDRVPAVSWDDELLGRAALGDVRGILGLPIFAENLVTFDFPKHELVLSRGALGLHDGSVPLHLAGGIPSFDLEVGGETIDVHLDTGNPGRLILPESVVAKIEWTSPPQVVGRARSPSGTFEIRRGTLRDALTLAGQTLEGPVDVTDRFAWANVGSGWLQDFALTIDLTNRRLSLRR